VLQDAPNNALTDAEVQLLTAAVDGELSTSDRPALARLLAQSPAAAKLHDQLLADRALLRALPVSACPETVFAAVMAQIQPITPAVRVVRKPRWYPAAVAASALLLVGSGSFLFFQSAENPRPTPVAKIAPEPIKKDAAVEVAVVPQAVPELVGPPAPPLADVIVKTPMREELPVPRPSTEGVLASPPSAPPKPLSQVEIKLPLLRPVAEFAAPAGKAQLLAELPADGLVRIDIFSTEPGKALDVLAAAARAANWNWSLDALTAERQKAKLPVAYAILSDSLTPAELADLLSVAATSDNSNSLSLAHVLPPAAADFKDWKDLTGTEPATTKKAKPEPRNISGSTADQVASALRAAKAEKGLLALTYLPPANRVAPQLSKEVQQFQQKRGEKKPGTLSVLIVVRTPAN
jgi:hypothetical protein